MMFVKLMIISIGTVDPNRGAHLLNISGLGVSVGSKLEKDDLTPLIFALPTLLDALHWTPIAVIPMSVRFVGFVAVELRGLRVIYVP